MAPRAKKGPCGGWEWLSCPPPCSPKCHVCWLGPEHGQVVSLFPVWGYHLSFSGTIPGDHLWTGPPDPWNQGASPAHSGVLWLPGRSTTAVVDGRIHSIIRSALTCQALLWVLGLCRHGVRLFSWGRTDPAVGSHPLHQHLLASGAVDHPGRSPAEPTPRGSQQPVGFGDQWGWKPWLPAALLQRGGRNVGEASVSGSIWKLVAGPRVFPRPSSSSKCCSR